MTLRWRIALVLCALVALTVLALTYIFHHEVLKDHRRDHANWASTLSNALAKAILRDTLEGRQIEVRDTLRRAQKTNPDILYLVEIGFDGKPFASTFDGEMPSELRRLDHRHCRPGSIFRLRMGERQVQDVAYPLVDQLDAHLHMGFDEDAFNRSVTQATLKTALVGSLILLGALVVAVIIARRIASPLMQLAASVEAFGRGENFDTRRVSGGDAEVRKLVDSFDRMAQERQEADAALRRFKTTLDRTQDCVFMFTADTLQFFYVNQGAVDQVGYTQEELLRMTPIDIKPDFDEAQFREMIAPMLLGQAHFLNFETRHRHKDGHDVPVEIALQYVAPAGETPRFVAIVRDITERKRAEDALRHLNLELEDRVTQRTAELANSNAQLKKTLDTLQHAQDELVRSEKLASLGSLVAGVAHELNTPLGNSVTIATSLADRIRRFEEELSTGSVRRSSLAGFVEFARKACTILTSSLFTASELISHFKQVAVDQSSAQRRPFDLAQVVGEVAMTLQPQFKKTPYDLQVDVPAGIRMDSYPGPLGQVLTNLVSNALIHGFSDRPQGIVRVDANAAGDQVCIRVTDDGNGIPPEHLGRIFDPFFTTRLGQGGSGLGLHIVYSIANRVLGGRIDVKSEPGQGCVFTLEIPLSPPDSAGNSLSSAIAIGQR